MPHAYEAGHPYNPNLVMPATDTAQYSYRSGQHELVGFLRAPRPPEVQDWKSGRAEFALFTQGDLLLLCYRFGRAPWSDAPFSWHLVRETEQSLPDPGDEGGLKRRILSIVLVDRRTGLVLALRAVTFSPEFTQALHAAIRAQASRPWPGDPEYDRQLQALSARYPDAGDLVRDAAARCIGGLP